MKDWSRSITNRIKMKFLIQLLICIAWNTCASCLPFRGPPAHQNAGGPPPRLDQQDWWKVGQDELNMALDIKQNLNAARNVILFLGDGMGVSTVTAARWLQAQQQNASIKDLLLSWETFPHVALSKTYSVNMKTADSASTGTSYLTGYKARTGTIGVNQDVLLGDCDSLANHTERALKSILEHSHDQGKWTGIVTTARVTHATPAAAYASSPDRHWEFEGEGQCKDITSQLIDNHDYIRVILGGGRQNFLPKHMRDPEWPENEMLREDGRDLIQDWQWKQGNKTSAERVKFVMNQTDFDEVNTNTVEYLMGLFEPSHMQYEVDREDTKKERWGEPSLTEMTEKAIRILQRGDKGYFLLVEGARIDKAHHEGMAFKALTETIEMSNAVKRAQEITSPSDTLIVVTADHSHVFTMGNNDVSANIMDVSDKKADDNMLYSSLSYANGPGFLYHRTVNHSLASGLRPHRRNLTEDFLTRKMRGKDYKQPAEVPLKLESHGGEDVAIYASGPMSHLFHGSHEQNYIAHAMMYASCVGPNKDKCKSSAAIHVPRLYIVTLLLALLYTNTSE